MKEALVDIYESVVVSLPENFRILPPLFVFAVLMALYAIFVFVFYRFLAKRDIMKLNLKKYNIFEHAKTVKGLAIFFYLLKFVIIIPIVITLWFAFLSVLLVVLAKQQPVATVLLISASIIGAIRITAYFREDLSRDLAKMFPFTLLGVAILSPGFFEPVSTIARISEIPTLFNVILYYALFIVIVEVVLRLFFVAYKAITSGGEDLGLDADWVEVDEEEVSV